MAMVIVRISSSYWPQSRSCEIMHTNWPRQCSPCTITIRWLISYTLIVYILRTSSQARKYTPAHNPLQPIFPPTIPFLLWKSRLNLGSSPTTFSTYTSLHFQTLNWRCCPYRPRYPFTVPIPFRPPNTRLPLASSTRIFHFPRNG